MAIAVDSKEWNEWNDKFLGVSWEDEPSGDFFCTAHRVAVSFINANPSCPLTVDDLVEQYIINTQALSKLDDSYNPLDGDSDNARAVARAIAEATAKGGTDTIEMEECQDGVIVNKKLVRLSANELA